MRAGKGHVAQPGPRHPETLPKLLSCTPLSCVAHPKAAPIIWAPSVPISNSAFCSRKQTLGQITHLEIIVIIPATLSLPISPSSLADTLFLVTLF